MKAKRRATTRKSAPGRKSATDDQQLWPEMAKKLSSYALLLAIAKKTWRLLGGKSFLKFLIVIASLFFIRKRWKETDSAGSTNSRLSNKTVM